MEVPAGKSSVDCAASGKSIRGKRTPSLPSGPVKSHARDLRIARIQEAVAQGSYEVSASDLAEKLIDHMLGR